ncbi:hypothetical protein L210DRAFT_3505969 [Boletus edulis BED1]|uniref:Uncharacterized protein n=1 Tax=Boletus edulis BED1 TaxID=1328754 RepID=A0AAD4BPD4_BOLED|nr:hypothetical protein L210DRAFT_3505969 [Boletus edulis BED1]
MAESSDSKYFRDGGFRPSLGQPGGSPATSSYNNGILWFNGHLVVVSDDKIKQFDAIKRHGGFIAYSTSNTVTFWDTSTHAQLRVTPYPQDIFAISIPAGDRCLAVGGKDGKISIKNLSGYLSRWIRAYLDELSYSDQQDSIHCLVYTAATFQEPDIQIVDTALEAWKNDQLENTEVLLTSAFGTTQKPSHHAIQPSVIGFIAKSVAHVGMGERDKGYRTCESHSSVSTHLTLALSSLSRFIFSIELGYHSNAHLLQAIVVFMTGEQLDVILRLGDLIDTIERSDYEGAIQSFESARAQIRHYENRPLLVVSLVRLSMAVLHCVEIAYDLLYMSGWKFDDLNITIRQRLCESLYAAGHTKDAVECYHQMASESNGETKLHGERLEWALNFRQRSFKELECLGDTAADALQYDAAISRYSIALSLDLPSPQRNEALGDASQVVALGPSSPWGYQMKHAALHKAGDYDNAVDALESTVICTSAHPAAHERRSVKLFKGPSVICQACSSTRLPVISTTELHKHLHSNLQRARIKREVRQYFRYVMLSHKWEDNEPLYHQVIHIAVYDLEKSLTHDKLQTFCPGGDVQVVSKGSVLTIRGVRSSSQFGALVRSIWNTRAWTLQEYIAAKAIHFCKEDWTLHIPQPGGAKPQGITGSHIGDGASYRGICTVIFSVAGIPAIYGEGEGSLEGVETIVTTVHPSSFHFIRPRKGTEVVRSSQRAVCTLVCGELYDTSSPYLVHPWLDALLERDDEDGVFMEEDVVPSPSPHMDHGEFSDGQGSRSTTARCPSQTAIWCTLTHTGVNGSPRRAVDHERAAADSLITVQFQDNVSLADILDNHPGDMEPYYSVERPLFRHELQGLTWQAAASTDSLRTD